MNNRKNDRSTMTASNTGKNDFEYSIKIGSGKVLLVAACWRDLAKSSASTNQIKPVSAVAITNKNSKSK